MKKLLCLALASCSILVPAAFGQARATQQEPIRIGVILEQSGAFAEYGRQMEGGIKAFMKRHGDEVAGRKIRLIVRDSTGPHPEVSKRLAQELISREKVSVLAGFGFSNAALAVAPLATQSKTPMVLMNAAASTITEASPYVVRTSFTLAQASEPMGVWAAKNGIASVMTVVADYSPGVDAEKAFKEGYLGNGGKIVGELRVPLANVDFAPYLQRVKDTRPDAVFVFLPAGQPMIAFMKIFDERGMKQAGIQVIAAAAWADDFELRAIGKPGLGVISTSSYSTSHDSDMNRRFVADFHAVDNSGLIPNYMAVSAYDGMAVIYKAIEALNGDTDGEKLMAEIKGMRLESPRGPIEIDADTRDIIQTIYVRRVEDVDGQHTNVEFDGFPRVKDPVKANKGG